MDELEAGDRLRPPTGPSSRLISHVQRGSLTEEEDAAAGDVDEYFLRRAPRPMANSSAVTSHRERLHTPRRMREESELPRLEFEVDSISVDQIFAALDTHLAQLDGPPPRPRSVLLPPELPSLPDTPPAPALLLPHANRFPSVPVRARLRPPPPPPHLLVLPPTPEIQPPADEERASESDTIPLPELSLSHGPDLSLSQSSSFSSACSESLASVEAPPDPEAHGRAEALYHALVGGPGFQSHQPGKTSVVGQAVWWPAQHGGHPHPRSRWGGARMGSEDGVSALGRCSRLAKIMGETDDQGECMMIGMAI